MSYSDYENSADFYSEVPFRHRNESDNEPVSFAHVPAVKQLVIRNIFPGEISDITMRMVSLPDGSRVQAEDVFECDKDELIEDHSQIDPFIEIMMQTRKSFVIGNKHTGRSVRISIIKPDDPSLFRNSVVRTLTRKRTSGTHSPINK
jgi:hypothetical protein